MYFFNNNFLFVIHSFLFFFLEEKTCIFYSKHGFSTLKITIIYKAILTQETKNSVSIIFM
jgi:hypothetical protein